MSADTSAVAGGTSHGTVNLPNQFNNFVIAVKTDGGSVNIADSSATVIGTVGDITGIDTTNGGLNSAGASVVLAKFSSQ